MCDKSLCKICVDKRHLYLFTKAWEEGNGGFEIILTDAEKAWGGTVTEEDLGILAKTIKMNFENFISETRKALTRRNIGSLNFEYNLKESVFTWKKYIPTNKIRIQLGQVKLSVKDDFSAIIREMLEHSISVADEAQETISSLKSDNERLSAERTAALKKFETAVNNKEDMETSLFSKFVVVVNEKKKKLRSLKQQVEGSSSSSAVASTSKGVVYDEDRRMETTEEQSDNEGHGSDYDTDEEKEADGRSDGQSVSKKGKWSVEESGDHSDDLLLDIDASDSSPVTTTVRRRGRKPVVKKTPSKPVIPKVTSSTEKANSSKSRYSMRKTDSQTSNHSKSSRTSSNASADDLLADL